jgi:hypothetical protein
MPVQPLRDAAAAAHRERRGYAHESCFVIWPLEAAKRRLTALVQRSQEALLMPLTESGGAVRTNRRLRRGLLRSFAARGGGA